MWEFTESKLSCVMISRGETASTPIILSICLRLGGNTTLEGMYFWVVRLEMRMSKICPSHSESG